MKNLPKIALGAWAWGNDGSLSAEPLRPIFDTAMKDGLSLWDTAYAYGVITSRLKNHIVRIILGIVMTAISYLFFSTDMLNYIPLKNPFAFLDYTKPWRLVILENLAMLLAWGFAAYLLSLGMKKLSRKSAIYMKEVI